MTETPMAEKSPGRKWRCGTWTAIVVGFLLAYWIGGCALSEVINASKAAKVKIGMTPAEVEALLGPPIQKITVGELKAPVEYRYYYAGYGDLDRIDVTYDPNFRVIRVDHWSFPPTWLQHTIG
jgi:hypothetical protein